MRTDIQRLDYHRRKLLALRLFSLTNKKHIPGRDIPTISFEDLGVPFQAPIAMDLRNVGLCSLSCDADWECGLRLKREYVGLTMKQYVETLKGLNIY